MSSRFGKSILVSVTILFCATVFSCKQRPAPFERTLEQEVRDTLDFTKFDKNKFDDHSAVLVAAEGGRRFFTRDDSEQFISHAREKGEVYKASDFTLIDKNESDKSRFATITYGVTWKVSLDNQTRLMHVTSHEIWERQIDGWHRLFAAVDSATPMKGDYKAQPQIISAYSDKTGQHPGLAAVAGAAQVKCVGARSDISNPQPTSSCNIVAPGYNGDLKVGASIGTSGAGTVTLTCNGQGNRLDCDARVQ